MYTKCHVVFSCHTRLPTKSPSVVYGFSLLASLSSTKYCCMILWALPLLFPRLSKRRVTGGEEMSIRVAVAGKGSGDWWGFISGCILGRKTSCLFLFRLYETKSEGENCKDTNWDLENLGDGKQSLNLLFILNVQSDKCKSTNYCIFQRKNKVHLVICHSCTVARLQIQSHESFVLKF